VKRKLLPVLLAAVVVAGVVLPGVGLTGRRGSDQKGTGPARSEAPVPAREESPTPRWRYEQIKKGMSRAEAEKVLGGRSGDFTTAPRAERLSFWYNGEFGGLRPSAEPGPVTKGLQYSYGDDNMVSVEEWRWDAGSVWLCFLRDAVRDKAYAPATEDPNARQEFLRVRRGER
jgi:hypothetical protein